MNRHSSSRSLRARRLAKHTLDSLGEFLHIDAVSGVLLLVTAAAA